MKLHRRVSDPMIPASRLFDDLHNIESTCVSKVIIYFGVNLSHASFTILDLHAVPGFSSSFLCTGFRLGDLVGRITVQDRLVG